MSDAEFTVTPSKQVKNPKGALNVMLGLRELKAALRLESNVELVYAGDFDYMTQGIRLTFTGEGLPEVREGCIPDDGWIWVELDREGNVVSSELDVMPFQK